MRIVAVTGGSSALGCAVVGELRSAGWWCRCLVRNRPVPGADEQIAGDVCSGAGLAELLDGAVTVIHMAAVTHARRSSEYVSTNVEGTRRLLDAARGSRPRVLVYVSTRAIDPRGGAYSRTKAEAEKLVKSAAVPSTILRLAEVYGAGASQGVDALLARAHRGAPIPVPAGGPYVLAPVFVDDVVSAVAVAAAGAFTCRTYTLAGPRVALREFAELAAAAAGQGSRVVSVPTALVRAIAKASRILPVPLAPDQFSRLRIPKADASRDAETDLGFRPRSVAEGIVEALRRYGP